MVKRNEEHRLKFAAYINQGIKLVGALQEKSVAEIEEELSQNSGRTIKAIQSYRQGTIPPDEVLLKLLHYFVNEAKVEQKWVEEMLKAIEYRDWESVRTTLFPDVPIEGITSLPDTIHLPVVVSSAAVSPSSPLDITKSLIPYHFRWFIPLSILAIALTFSFRELPGIQQFMLQDGRLLLDGGFEKTTQLFHWRNVGGCTMTVKEGDAVEGNHYLEVIGLAPCYSFSQDTLVSPVLRRTYTFSAWFRSPDSAYPKASLVIWGGRMIREQFNDLESGSTEFQIMESNWQCIATTITVSNPDTTRLRAEVYLGGFDGQVYEIDDVRFTEGDTSPCPKMPPQIYNASFEEQANSIPPWIVNGNCKTEVRQIPMAHEGEALMSLTREDRECRSIYQLLNVEVVPNDTYNFSIWVRSPDGKERTVETVMWARGDITEKSPRYYTFQDNEWQCVEATLRTQQSGKIELLLEIYFHSPAEFWLDNANFQIGGATLCPTSPLRITELSLPFGIKTEYFAGAIIPIIATVSNQGARDSLPTGIRYWLSPQINADGADESAINEILIPVLSPNSTFTKDEDALFIPTELETGQYYVIAGLEGNENRYTLPEPVTIVACKSASDQYFCDISDEHWAAHGIQQWAEIGITTGCRTGTEPFINRPFCPKLVVDNWALASFLIRYLKGIDFQPPEPLNPYYTDEFPDGRGRLALEFFHQNGIDLLPTGCSTTVEAPKSCPQQMVTRGDLARYLALVLKWDLDSLPTPSQNTFFDLPEDNFTRQAILYMDSHGFLEFSEPDCLPTNGKRRFCPEAPLRRANAAAIMTKVFEESEIPFYP